MISERSPGARDPGALYSVKPERVLPTARQALAGPPQERVLGLARERPEPLAALLPAEAPPLNLLLDQAPMMVGPTPIDLGLPLVPPMPDFRSLPPPACCAQPIVSTPVPEPTTWLMNIIGLFAVGAAMRYRQSRNPGSRLLRG